MVVKPAVVLRRAESAVLLADEEEGGGDGGVGGTDAAGPQVLVEELVHGGLLSGGKGVHTAAHLAVILPAGLEVDLVVPTPVRWQLIELLLLEDIGEVAVDRGNLDRLLGVGLGLYTGGNGLESADILAALGGVEVVQVVKDGGEVGVGEGVDR